jgi:hypothetical protein
MTTVLGLFETEMSVLDPGLTLLVVHSLILDDQRMNHEFPDDDLGIMYEKNDERLGNARPDRGDL